MFSAVVAFRSVRFTQANTLGVGDRCPLSARSGHLIRWPKSHYGFGLRTCNSCEQCRSALFRCHHVDMRRHDGNLLAPTFGALGLRCPMLRNCLGTFERGTAFLAVILIGRHDGAPLRPDRDPKKGWAVHKPIYVAQSSRRLAEPQ
jgi:hypothetical protein